MARNYAAAYGAGTKDPGVLEELKQEAVEDVTEAVTDAALNVAAGAKNIAEGAPKAYRAAVEHPAEFSRFTIRSLERYIRHNPFEAMTIVAGIAFAFGGLWGVSRKERKYPIQYQAYQCPERHQMVRTFENAPDDAASYQSDLRRSVELAKDATADRFDSLSSLAREAMDDPQRFARATVDDVSRFTKDKPLQALGIAAGLALLVGSFWRR